MVEARNLPAEPLRVRREGFQPFPPYNFNMTPTDNNDPILLIKWHDREEERPPCRPNGGKAALA